MASRVLRNLTFRPLAILFATTLGLLLADREAEAQRAPYNNFQINKIISAPGPLTPENKAILDEYFDGWFLRLFAKPSRPDLLPLLRNKSFKFVVKNADKTPAHDYVNKKLFNAMLKLLRSPSKSVRVNAMLMMAELNESDAKLNMKAYPDAYSVVVKGLTLPESWDYVKPAALVGLQRYADFGLIPPAHVGAITKKLLAMVKQEDPPAGRTASVHNFFRRKAAAILGTIGNPGPNNEVVEAFASIAADPQNPITLRCEMTRNIGLLKYPPDSKVNVVDLAAIVSHQAVEICQQQLDSGSADDRAKDVDSSGAMTRRIAMYALDCCTDTLQKLSSASGGEKSIYEVKKRMDALYRQLDDVEANGDRAVPDLVAAELAEIESVLPPKPDVKPLVASSAAEATGQASTK